MESQSPHKQAHAGSTARRLRRTRLLEATNTNWRALGIQMLAGGLVGATLCKFLLRHLPFITVMPMVFYVSLASSGLLGLIGLIIMTRHFKGRGTTLPWVVSTAFLALGLAPASMAYKPLANSQSVMELCLKAEPRAIDVYDMNGSRRGRNLITADKDLAAFKTACRRAVHSPIPIPDIPALGRIDVYAGNIPSSLIFGLNKAGQTVLYLPGGGGAIVPANFETLTEWDHTVSILVTNACSTAVSNITIQWDGIHLELHSLNKGAYEYFSQQAWPEDFIHISYHSRFPEQSFTDILNQNPDAGMLTISINDTGPPIYTTGEIKIPEAGRWQMRSH